MGIIDEKVKHLPTDPGVYVMLDKDGHIIYVGKAKNLKNRVRQYFQNGVKTDKVMAMVNNVHDFYYYITPTEIDALSLENNLIKKHKPRYNILLKDDKTYPYLSVNLKDDYPTFTITRKIKKDGAKYFGPFMGGVSVSNVLDIVNLSFGVRPCQLKLSKDKVYKPCLNYHIERCGAPCAKYISRDEYMERVKLAIEFLEGDLSKAEKLLKEKMVRLAESENFELALKYKENLLSLDKIKEKRLTALNKFINADILAIETDEIHTVISVLVVRSGRMVGGKNYSFDTCVGTMDEMLAEFILRYYKNHAEIPDEIITDRDLASAELLAQFIKTEYNKTVLISKAVQGVRRQLVDMAKVNAKEHLETAVGKIKHKFDMTLSACQRLQEILGLKKYPRRMECYDISNISGTDKVGSMVVFIDGEPDKSSYRRFRIKSVEGQDDYRSHQEMMRRRLDRMTTDPEKFPKPDLIIIDGGKGQLSSIKEVFSEFNIDDIDLISLAEKQEEIFTLYSSEPVVLSLRDYALKVLIRIRDEAHRFAVSYHTSLRDKKALVSVLDKIEGIGRSKRLLLIEKFKDVGGIISATEEEIASVKGIGKTLAKAIVDTLKKEGLK